MSEEGFGFSPPPFDPEATLQRLRRELRDLGLTEREGAFERRGLRIAQVRRAQGALLEVSIAVQPARSPQWQTRQVRDAAGARSFVADLKKRLLTWSDRDE